MQHEAIYALHSNVVTINGSGADAVAKDADGNVVSWDATTVSNKEKELITAFKLNELRIERNRLLAETDYLALSDQTLSAEMKTYRQALRDITKTATSLDDVKWPEKP
jgi:hypothetical protein